MKKKKQSAKQVNEVLVEKKGKGWERGSVEHGRKEMIAKDGERQREERCKGSE